MASVEGKGGSKQFHPEVEAPQLARIASVEPAPLGARGTR
jgi:hypothetical protein